jgi:hypothetical protein
LFIILSKIVSITLLVFQREAPAPRNAALLHFSGGGSTLSAYEPTRRATMRMLKLVGLFLLLFAVLLALPACGDDDDDDNDAAADDDDDTVPADDDSPGDDDDDDNNDDNDDNDDDDDTTPTGPFWEPNDCVPIDVHPDVRGRQVLRGIIHLHSVYSHDACDSRPFIGEEPNWACYNQLRAAMCNTRQQYVFLTDHAEPFNDFEFPDVLLYQPDEGDELIYEGDDPVANILTCDDGSEVILTAGNENAVMPVGLRRMPDGTPEQRRVLLRGDDVNTVDTMHDLGAKVFVNHSETWETQDLAALPIDGIEVYNLHANIDPGIREEFLDLPALGFILPLLHFLFPYAEAGHSDLILLTFLSANGPALDHWDKLLMLRPTVGIMGTDAHRNSLPFPLWDGDRADSYRRMMRWFANYVLADEQSLPAIEGAVAAGRMYGMFQVFGEAVGFDFFADTGDAYEMGEQVPLDDAPTLHVALPAFYKIDPALPAPELTLRIIRSTADGGEVVAEATDQSLEYMPDAPGAYRAEVHVTPYHLEPVMGDNAAMFLHEYPLIYANPIYVTD